MVNWNCELCAVELEGLAWMGPVDEEFSPAEDWLVHIQSTIRRWKIRAEYRGQYAPLGLQLVYDTAQEAMDAVRAGIEEFDPASFPKKEPEPVCPDCGAELRSVMYGKKGTVMERWVKTCPACGYDTDRFQELVDRIFPKPAPAQEDDSLIIRNIIGR